MDKISLLADLYDELALKVYEVNKEEEIKITYLEALTYALNLLNGTIENIDKCYKPFIKKIEEVDVDSIELKRALLLDEIKALKDLNLSLDAITPDVIGVILAYIIKEKPDLKILELGLGMGNLTNNLINSLNSDPYIIGIEQNALLCKYNEAYANLLGTKMEVHMEDILSFNYPNVDAIVADLDNYQYENEYYHSELYDQGVRDFVYLAIEKHLKSGTDSALAYYVVSTDFFNLEGSLLFKEFFKKYAYFKGIISLPKTFFRTKSKMILIVEKITSQKTIGTSVYNLPSIQEKEKFKQILLDIKKNMEK